jgi:hypothetical protein
MTDTIRQTSEGEGEDGGGSDVTPSGPAETTDPPETAEPSDTGTGRHTGTGADERPRRARVLALVAGLTAVAGGIPLAVALGVLHNPRWYPLLDLAQTELRVRDVGSSHPPLVGLAGRLLGPEGPNGARISGSHPGPLSFYSLFPFYKLFGSSAWALEAATASLNLIAMGLAIWMGHRRGGLYGALGMATALALLGRAYGADWLTEPWNPYMPMLWWTVFLMAAWSILCDDLPMLPIAVFAGTFCMQTHIPYTGMVGGMGVIVVAATVVAFWSRRHEAGAARRLLRWTLPSVALLAVLWVPPVYDQLTREPGNLTIIKENFARPPAVEQSDGTFAEEPTVGGRTAAKTLLANLDVTTLVRGGQRDNEADSGTNLLGLALVAVWAAAAALAWRRGCGQVLRLHLVIAAALALGFFSISRILGFLWYYLVLWSWGTMTLAVVAIVWTAALFVRDQTTPAPTAEGDEAGDDTAMATTTTTTSGIQRRLGLLATGALAAVLVAATASFTYDAAHTEFPAARESRSLRHIAPTVVAALASGDLPGGGKDGRYLVVWDEDALAIGSQGYGFLDELERQGFDVGVRSQHATGSVPHRVLDPADATATVNYVIGQANIDRWRSDPQAVEVTFFEPRTPAQLERFDELHAEAVAGLRDAGLNDLVTLLDNKLFLVGLDERTPPAVADEVGQMMDLGLPTAVFVAPALDG